MTSARRRSARATAVVAATLLMVSFGTVGAAFADPGNGNGNVPENAQAANNDGNGNGAGAAAAADNGPAANGNAGDNAGNGNGGNGAANGAGNGNGADNSNGIGNGVANAAASTAAAAASSSAASAGDNGKSSTAKSSGSNSSSAKPSGSSAKSSSSATVSNGKAADHKTKGTAGTSGNVNQPQPISGADDNPGGANGQCPGGVYCSTRNGSPSMNGQGKGKAVGKPCAGCVGKADNKNPHGQMPGPSDRNAGYECDRNNGIGKTNPAHTGCKPGTPPPCVDQPGKPCTPPPGCVPTAANNFCQPPAACVPTAANNFCQPPVVCVPTAANNYCGPPPPVIQCPPGSVLGPNGECIFGEEEILCPNGSVMPPSGKCDHKKPPTVRGQEAFRPQPSAAVSQPVSGVLPATGANSGLGLMTGAGFAMLAVGAGALLRRRTH